MFQVASVGSTMNSVSICHPTASLSLLLPATVKWGLLRMLDHVLWEWCHCWLCKWYFWHKFGSTIHLNLDFHPSLAKYNILSLAGWSVYIGCVLNRKRCMIRSAELILVLKRWVHNSFSLFERNVLMPLKHRISSTLAYKDLIDLSGVVEIMLWR